MAAADHDDHGSGAGAITFIQTKVKSTAANPATSDYLFYVANPCKPGTHTFHRTLAEFNAAAARYNQAREAAGGKAPKGC